MSDKKNIDRLFQEKLKDFEVTPAKSVWKNISANLKNNKHDKKGVIVWWRVAGIAAAILLLFTINKLVQNNNTITTSEETIVDVNSKKDTINNDLQDVVNKENIIAKEKNILETIKHKSSNNSITNNITTATQNILPITKSKPQNNNTSNLNKVDVFASSTQTKNVLAQNTKSKLLNEKTRNKSIDKARIDAILKNDTNTKEAIAAKESNNKTKIEEEKDIIKSKEINTIIEEEKMSLTDAVATIEKEDIEDNTDEKLERWKIASNIAPVYFNTLGKGSSIHPQFNNNSKTGNINMSYGVSGSYAINKKLSVRAGINKVNLGYSTNNVVVFANVDSPNNPQLLRNMQLNEAGQNLSFISVEVFNFAQVPDLINNFIKSSIDQRLGFIEIPLELEYKISDKKVGINLIGGFSALFLSENEIYSVLNGNSTLLGEATNINNTSFSANFGLGFDFKILDKLNLNLEPVFKYQINTFNNTSGDFKPYFIGIYSGLSFKF